jgi:hypothetical protein
MSEENLATTGTTENDHAFDPSAWIENLASILAAFLADPRLRYAQGVLPNVIDGELSLLLATWLETTDPATYAYVMEFARANQLRTKVDCRTGERAIPKPA